MTYEPRLGRIAYSEVLEDYLKRIFLIAQERGRVTTSDLARAFTVAPATVTQTLKRLSHLQLVEHTPYYGVKLTEKGERIARELVRHHRLIELYLAKVLGIPWERVHEEAERWEHVISEEVEENIARFLGDPLYDPHGAPIPPFTSSTLKMHEETPLLLSDLTAGEEGVIMALEDELEEILKIASQWGLFPGVSFRVQAVCPQGFTLRIGEGEERNLPHQLANKLWVRRQEGVEAGLERGKEPDPQPSFPS